MAVSTEWRAVVAGAARMFGLSHDAMGKRIERAAGKSGAREVCFDGLRVVRTGPRSRVVYVGPKWLAEGQYQQWAPLKVFAKDRGLCPRELRRELKENAKYTSDGVESTCEGHAARTLGDRWMICLGAGLQ